MKIIFCTDGIFPHAVGGMQRHSRLLIEELARQPEMKIIVIHPHSQNIFNDENITEELLKGIDESKNYLLECYRYSKRVYSVLNKYPEHVIYSQGLCVWYKIQKFSTRLIINPHGLEPFQAISLVDKIKAIPFKILFNYLFKHAAKIVSLGGRLTDILTTKVNNKSKIVVIPNATNLPMKESTERNYSGKLKILFVARFASNKGIHILLETIKQLNYEGYKDKMIWNIGGKGPLFNYYVRNFNYENVNYLGFVTDEELATLYKNSHLFVFPTLFEGMPTVVLEAMSYSIPVIVSDVGATAELVDATNGYLVKKNNIQALKNSIIEFFKLSDIDKKMLALNSYKKVKNDFTWESVAMKHVVLFDTLNSSTKND